MRIQDAPQRGRRVPLRQQSSAEISKPIIQQVITALVLHGGHGGTPAASRGLWLVLNRAARARALRSTKEEVLQGGGDAIEVAGQTEDADVAGGVVEAGGKAATKNSNLRTRAREGNSYEEEREREKTTLKQGELKKTRGKE